MLRGSEPKPADVRAFDVSLILYAEHEFNASTFTARVVCLDASPTCTRPSSAAIGALEGPAARRRQREGDGPAAGGRRPGDAEKWMREALARKERIMGFGHRVYKAGDVRAGILKEYARKAAEAAGPDTWEETAEIIEKRPGEEKNLFPNLDWPAGRLYHALGLEMPLYTPIFVMCARHRLVAPTSSSSTTTTG